MITNKPLECVLFLWHVHLLSRVTPILAKTRFIGEDGGRLLQNVDPDSVGLIERWRRKRINQIFNPDYNVLTRLSSGSRIKIRYWEEILRRRGMIIKDENRKDVEEMLRLSNTELSRVVEKSLNRKRFSKPMRSLE
ncbi:hypothetical protein KC842_02510 [Candidatus Nomurabacteria bacterium]|nr:hypothetical protein [Candidatus Nomurabacteria bacterium]USN94994.1 MAG: hypothetical protein H6791_01015 [Candidatus Nomurabacteria bacterium]